MCSEHMQRCYWDNLYYNAACLCLMFKYFQICKYLHVCDWAVAFLTLDVKLFVRVCPEFETCYNPRHISKYWALNTGKTWWPGKNWDRLNTFILCVVVFFVLGEVSIFSCCMSHYSTILWCICNTQMEFDTIEMLMYSESLISNIS